MSTNADMVHHSGNSDKVEEALVRMENSFDDASMFHEGMPPSEMAKVLQLDKELGLAQDDDRVIFHPMLGSMLPVTARITAPAALVPLAEKLVQSYADGPELTDEEDAALMSLLTDWFEVRFDLKDPESGVQFPCHPILQDRTFTVRLLTEREMLADPGFVCASVRADGTLISTKEQTKF